jgi:hypothetical protein
MWQRGCDGCMGCQSMSKIIGYRLTVSRGARTGLVREYGQAQRNAARRFADRLDQEYGAICASVSPIFATQESHT